MYCQHDLIISAGSRSSKGSQPSASWHIQALLFYGVFALTSLRNIGFFKFHSKDSAASFSFSALVVLMLPVVGVLSFMKDKSPVRMVPTLPEFHGIGT